MLRKTTLTLGTLVLLLLRVTVVSARLSPGFSIFGLILRIFGFFLPFIQSFFRNILGIEASPPFGTCDGCFCVPESGKPCPANTPRTDFSDLIPVLQSFTLENQYTLTCDPYNDAGCDTQPPIQEGGACILQFSGPAGTCPTNWTYRLETYNGTFEEAKKKVDTYVTHAGNCGACSSLHDLSVYMNLGADLEDEVAACSYIENVEEGIGCYENLGYSRPCATIWNWNSKAVRARCIKQCIPHTLLGLPPNGDPPECKLVDCIQCDEVNNGPIFAKFAGRTRRSSGLLSNIVRPCSQLVELVHENPCQKSV
jgi:hypothetical protein